MGGGGPPQVLNALLPDPKDVASARVTVVDSVLHTMVGIRTVPANAVSSLQSAFGSFEFTQSWNGLETFHGLAAFSGGTIPSLSGDFIPLSSQFNLGRLQINSNDLNITDTVTFDINYADFFETKEVSAEFSGQMIAQAGLTVPEPAALIHGALGLVSLVGTAFLRNRVTLGYGWKRRKRSVA